MFETPSSSSDYSFDLVAGDHAGALGSPPDVKVQPAMPAEIDPDNTLTVALSKDSGLLSGIRTAMRISAP